MKLEILWHENSTKRGAIWVCGSLFALLFYWYGKDPVPVMMVTSSLAGGLGLLVKD
jgi:hypothetical protein